VIEPAAKAVCVASTKTPKKANIETRNFAQASFMGRQVTPIRIAHDMRKRGTGGS
jgi:hypothetical protein